MEAGRKEIWLETLASRRVPFKLDEKKSHKRYFHYPKREAQVIFAYYTDSLQLKNHARHEYRKVFGDINCLLGCEEPDDWDHLKNCGRYPVKWDESAEWDPQVLLNYLKAVEDVRVREAGFPLIYRRYERHRPVINPE